MHGSMLRLAPDDVPFDCLFNTIQPRTEKRKANQLVKVRVRESATVPADVYQLKVTHVEPKETEFGTAARISFLIVESDFAGIEVSGFATIRTSGVGPECKLRRWTLGPKVQGSHVTDGRRCERRCGLRVEEQPELQSTTFFAACSTRRLGWGGLRNGWR